LRSEELNNLQEALIVITFSIIRTPTYFCGVCNTRNLELSIGIHSSNLELHLSKCIKTSLSSQSVSTTLAEYLRMNNNIFHPNFEKLLIHILSMCKIANFSVSHNNFSRLHHINFLLKLYSTILATFH